MLPYKTLIHLDRAKTQPLYLQLVNRLIDLIQAAHLQAGKKLPGSRQMASLLEIHRKTVIQAYDELYAQAWIDIIPYKGTFVAQNLAMVQAKRLAVKDSLYFPQKAGYEILRTADEMIIHSPEMRKGGEKLSFDEGFPDLRLAPAKELSITYARVLRRQSQRNLLGYGEAAGALELRSILALQLNETRGLKCKPKHILITRGSQMAIYLSALALIKPGDGVIVGETSFYIANRIFHLLGAKLHYIPVDKHGLCVEDIHLICQKHSIRVLYLTSHHHHPTTVTLVPERRLQLLNLAQLYGFAIMEDDYDYDFHYANSPILPLASADTHGHVIYMGSFSKTTAPAFRVGYIVAPEDLIRYLKQLRLLIDRQGDSTMELAFAELLEAGIIRRYLKKALNVYHNRRDLCCDLLQKHLGEYISFDVPDGGMAIWVRFDPAIDMVKLSKEASKRGLHISDGKKYNPINQALNASRLGFASMNSEELREAVHILEETLRFLNVQK